MNNEHFFMIFVLLSIFLIEIPISLKFITVFLKLQLENLMTNQFENSFSKYHIEENGD